MSGAALRAADRAGRRVCDEILWVAGLLGLVGGLWSAGLDRVPTSLPSPVSGRPALAPAAFVLQMLLYSGAETSVPRTRTGGPTPRHTPADRPGLPSDEGAGPADATAERAFYALTHDIRTPILSIRGLSESIYDVINNSEGDAATARKLAHRLVATSVLLEELVADVMLFASGGRAAERVSFEAGAILRPTLETLRPYAEERHVTVLGNGPEVTLVSDPNRVRRIVLNLVQNAIKHMPERTAGVVRVHWHAQQNAFNVIVEDNGAGLPPDARRSLLAPPTDLPVSSPHAQGLGLAIVRRFVHSLGGTIAVGVPAGAGCSILVRLPLTAPPAPPAPAASPPPEHGTNEPGASPHDGPPAAPSDPAGPP